MDLAPHQSGNLSCLMAPAGRWELAFFCFGVGAYFSRVSAIFFFVCGVFALFGGDFAFFGVISRFFGCFRATRLIGVD